MGRQSSSVLSYISHHMLFDRLVLGRLRAEIEELHGMPWYQAIISTIDKSEQSAFAEFELYGNYYRASKKHGVVRNYWFNLSLPANEVVHLEKIKHEYAKHFKTVSFHSYNS